MGSMTLRYSGGAVGTAEGVGDVPDQVDFIAEVIHAVAFPGCPGGWWFELPNPSRALHITG